MADRRYGRSPHRCSRRRRRSAWGAEGASRAGCFRTPEVPTGHGSTSSPHDQAGWSRCGVDCDHPLVRFARRTSGEVDRIDLARLTAVLASGGDPLWGPRSPFAHQTERFDGVDQRGRYPSFSLAISHRHRSSYPSPAALPRRCRRPRRAGGRWNRHGPDAAWALLRGFVRNSAFFGMGTIRHRDVGSLERHHRLGGVRRRRCRDSRSLR